ncbi:SDR family NAD(P)-dependent oxidoreductase [Hymenobacter koreensis]|uniref:SDR family oxidoreductase n=1 Tax=Hymenobacter koreensis TaxID=1084523 RepID=A0ABP8J5V9_9BACT
MISDSAAPLRGKTILLTGASGGIGLAAAHQLAALGAHLLLVCRNPDRGEQAREAVEQAAPGTRIELLLCNLSQLAEINQLCDQILECYPRLDVLINNAGVLPSRLQVTAEGHELCWVTNHLAPFVLTNRLLPLLEASPAGRVITVASEAHRLGEIETTATRRNDSAHNSAFTAYCDSKLANILFTKALAERLELTGITAYSLHPGIVRSKLFAGSSWLMRTLVKLATPFTISTEQAAAALVHLVTDHGATKYNGQYFKRGRPTSISNRAANLAEAQRLWRISADETGVGQ